MPIIPEDKTKVNIYEENYHGDRVEKWTNYKRESRTMARRLYVAGLTDRAARMYQCGDYILTTVNQTTGEVKTDTTILCRDRLCPLCSWRLSRRRFAEMMAVFSALKNEISENGYTVKMLTLTVRNIQLSDLGAAIDAFSRAWHNMSRREYFKQSCVGWARSLEITYNQQAATYHPHYHVIVIWKADADETKRAAELLKKAWKQAYNCDYDPIIDFRDVYSRDSEKGSIISSALEAFKYAVKPDSIKRVPDSDICEFAGVIKGARFVSYGKAIKAARQALGFKNDDMAEINPPNKLSDELVVAIMRWNGTAYTEAALTADRWRLSKDRLKEELQAAKNDEKEIYEV